MSLDYFEDLKIMLKSDLDSSCSRSHGTYWSGEVKLSMPPQGTMCGNYREKGKLENVGSHSKLIPSDDGSARDEVEMPTSTDSAQASTEC